MKRKHFDAKAESARENGDRFRRLSMAYALGAKPESPKPLVWVSTQSEHERRLTKKARKQARKDRQANRKKSRRARGKQFTEAYQRYIISDAWYAFRKTIFDARGRQCEKCKQADVELHLHHLTYARLGNEKPRDVKILCRACHEALHPHMAA